MKIMECIGNMGVSCAETACQFSVGQFFIRLLDRSVGIIERTAQWSLPSNEIIAENGKSFKDMELVRPLPWILFLPGLVVLRGFRFTWNIGAFFLGYNAIEPGDIVASLQRLRRRLRTIRLNGIRRMRKIRPTNSRDQNLGLNGSPRSLLQSIQLTLSTLSCFDASKMKSSPPPMQIRVPMNDDTTPALVEKSTTESTTMTQQCESKRKYSQVSSDDPLSEEESETDGMTLDMKLAHYADLDSSDDADFDSQNCTMETDDLASHEEEEEYGEDEVNLLVAEARDALRETCKEINPEMSEAEIISVLDEKLPPVENITTKNGNGNCVPNNLDDIQNYHSPCKSIEDTDTAFYSPISSKSTSPERDLATDNAVGIVHASTTTEINASKSSTIIREKEKKIDHDENNEKKNVTRIESPGTKGKLQRDNNKGKRSNHGNRKKKL